LSDFVVTTPGIGPGLQTESGEAIELEQSTPSFVEGDGWFPGLDIAEFRSEQRAGGSVTDLRIRGAIINAMITARRELAAWRACRTAEGVARLEDVASDQIDGESILVRLWRDAVTSYAAARLAETHRDITAVREERQRGEEKHLTADDHRRNATFAIRDILAVGRVAVELI